MNGEIRLYARMSGKTRNETTAPIPPVVPIRKASTLANAASRTRRPVTGPSGMPSRPKLATASSQRNPTAPTTPRLAVVDSFWGITLCAL